MPSAWPNDCSAAACSSPSSAAPKVSARPTALPEDRPAPSSSRGKHPWVGYRSSANFAHLPAAQWRRALGLLPSPLRGGVGGGGSLFQARFSRLTTTPTRLASLAPLPTR